MNNLHFTSNLNAHRDHILNYLSKNNKTFIFNFLNNKPTVGKMTVGTREQWHGAHFKVSYYEQNGKFKNFTNVKAFYVTFNVLNNAKKHGLRAVSLREDLIKYWALAQSTSSFSNNYVMVVDSLSMMIYSIKVTDLISEYVKLRKGQKCNASILNKDAAYVDISFNLVDSLYDDVDFYGENDVAYSGPYNTQYWHPEFIANFVYSKYRMGRELKLFSYNKEGKLMRTQQFRSVKEVYDILIKNGYDKSFKTLQRAVSSEELIELNCGYFYMTRDLDAEPQVIREVKEELGPNPFFNEDEPEDIDNPRLLPVRSYVSIKKERKQVTVDTVNDNLEQDFFDADDEDKQLSEQLTEPKEARKLFNIKQIIDGDEELKKLYEEALNACRIDHSYEVGPSLF